MKLKHYEPCRCGSGRKYKKCHAVQDHAESERKHVAAIEAWRAQRENETEAEKESRRRTLSTLISMAGVAGHGR